MRRTIARVLPALLLLTGCAGPQQLAQKSERNLSSGDHWRAWQLATRALDKAPANPRARSAATRAAASIAVEWARRIRAMAEHDSLAAAGQVLEFATFRANATRYVTVPVDLAWPDTEHALRGTAARIHYARGLEAWAAHRPKQAHGHFAGCVAFVPGHRDAAARAERAMERALARVAIVPLAGSAELGADVARRWTEGVDRALAGHATYTRVLPAGSVEPFLRVSQLYRVTREEAVRLGRRAGAQRVVWGTIGDVESRTRLEFFRDAVCRRVREKQPDGTTVTRWVDVPIEVVARLRDVTVHATYEVIATANGATLARQAFDRTTTARVLWTSHRPVGDLDAYALVPDGDRGGDRDRAKRIAARWSTACGEASLHDVLAARLATRGDGAYDRGLLSRFATGAAFVFLAELPPADDLAVAALTTCPPLERDLLRLDAVDDVDLAGGPASVER